ncbi:hypothetical protein HK100_009725, partial [Physocladia obscura]
WLNSATFSQEKQKFERLYLAGTCEWAVNIVTDRLRSSISGNVLWLNAHRGFGKSLIAWRVSQKLSDAVYSDYYFNENDSGKNNATSLVEKLACDFATYFVDFKAHVANLYEEEKENAMAEGYESLLSDPVRAFREIIVKGLKSLNRDNQKYILIVIDGLDKCGLTDRSVKDARTTRKSLLDIIENECQNLPPFVKIFVTAQPHSDIFESLLNVNAACVEVIDQIESDSGIVGYKFKNNEDIESFSRNKLEEILDTYELPKNVMDLLECIRILSKKSKGSFEYVRLLILDVDHRWSKENENSVHQRTMDLDVNHSWSKENENYVQPHTMGDLLRIFNQFDGGEDDLYLQILSREFERVNEETIVRFRQVMEILVAEPKPVTQEFIEKMLNLNSYEVGAIIIR